MRRAALVSAIGLALAVASGAAGSVAAEPHALYRASATSTAVHGFYDHEGLFPVPIMNVSVPYTEATYDPGPTTTALGSFLWNPQAAELGTIACVLSEGRLCELPEYPFQARASHPAAGRSEPPPTLSIEEPGAPVRVRAAHERAVADARGAASEATVAGFEAIPMTEEQLAAARAIALVAARFSPGTVEVEPWLVSIGDATSSSRTRSGGDGALAESRAELHDVGLLGGVIGIDVVRGTAAAGLEASRRGVAESVASGVTVADLGARVTPQGITIADRRVPVDAAGALQKVLDAALARAGIELVAGRERVRRAGERVEAETFALSLRFAGQSLPEHLPEGTQGRDVVRVPLGFASAEAAVARIASPPPRPPAADDAAPGGDEVSPDVGGLGGTGGVAPSPVAAALPSPAAVPEPAQVFPLSHLGVSRTALLAIVAAAVLFALVLGWLRVNEVLHEEVLGE